MLTVGALAAAVSAQQTACPELSSFQSLLEDCGTSDTSGVMNALAAAANGPVALHVNIARTFPAKDPPHFCYHPHLAIC